MSFVLPTHSSYVDKFPKHSPPTFGPPGFEASNVVPPTMWEIVTHYAAFKDIVKTARMEGILNDSQAAFTLFIPLDLPVNFTKAAMQFGRARTIVDSLIIPQKLSSTMMIQSAFTQYRTRDPINTLLLQTQHCVQFEPETYNKPPFGVIINRKSRVITPDIIASNGAVHTISSFPYDAPPWTTWSSSRSTTTCPNFAHAYQF